MADSTTGGGTSVMLVVPPSATVPAPPGSPVVLVPTRPHLPYTGFDVSTVLVLTALLLALGALLLIAGRRPASRFRRT